MEDVADRAGVSRSLVSLVMRGSTRVSESSRYKVVQAADELGYRPNMLARNLASGRTNTFGLVLDDFQNPYFTEVAEGAALGAAEAGYEVLVNSGWQRPRGETAALDALLARQVDGLIVVGARTSLDTLERFATQVAMVSINGPADAAGFDSVNNDEKVGAELIVDHLVDLGHKRIVHIDGGAGSGAPERRSAFTAAMLHHGLAPLCVDGEFDERAGLDAAASLLALHEPPTAIFAANDLCAVGVLGELARRGVKVPDDISVVGYDDTALAALGTVSLTTVDQPRRHHGAMAAELLLERVNGRSEAVHRFAEPRLVVRSTTGRCPTSR